MFKFFFSFLPYCFLDGKTLTRAKSWNDSRTFQYEYGVLDDIIIITILLTTFSPTIYTYRVCYIILEISGGSGGGGVIFQKINGPVRLRSKM